MISLIANFPTSRIAQLAKNSIQYTAANTSFPTESIPALAAAITGSSPKTHGMWDKTAYGRDLYPPGSKCLGPRGASIFYDESVSANSSALDGGCPGFNCKSR